MLLVRATWRRCWRIGICHHHDFLKTPNVVTQASGHTGSDSQRFVYAGEVVINGVDRNHSRVILNLLAETIGQSRKAPPARPLRSRGCRFDSLPVSSVSPTAISNTCLASWTGSRGRLLLPMVIATIFSPAAQQLGSRPHGRFFWRIRGECHLASSPIGRIGAVTFQAWFVSLPCSQFPTARRRLLPLWISN